MAAVQAVRLRTLQGELLIDNLEPSLRSFLDGFEKIVPFLTEDRPMDETIKHVAELIREQHWTLYA